MNTPPSSFPVRNGFPVFSYNLGGGSSVIRSLTRIDDGQIHKIEIGRSGRKGSIIVDDTDENFGESKVRRLFM